LTAASLASTLRRGTRYGALAIISLSISMPLLWMILSAFKGVEELWRFPPTLWPLKPTLSGYQTILSRMAFARYFFNSAFVSILSTGLVLLTSSLAGYVFAKIRFRGRNALFALVLACMMVPGQVTIIQNYVTIRWLGWLNTYQALIVPQGISVFGIFLMRQFLHNVPDSYIDVARIDGLRELGIYLRVVLPLSRSALAALAIFAFRGSWDTLLWPLIMTTKPEMRTLPVGIAGLATVHSPLMELLLPAATIAVVPVLLVFFVFQRRFVEGIAMTGLKA
jgi:multiple sugar transport system permease protein